jgi:hypothetical protein
VRDVGPQTTQVWPYATIRPSVVQKKNHRLTFLATVEAERPSMKTLLIISVLALLTLAGAVVTDQSLISEQGIEQAAN